MLSNAYFLAKFRFDTAENEPAKNLQNFRKMHFSKMHFSKMHLSFSSHRQGLALLPVPSLSLSRSRLFDDVRDNFEHGAPRSQRLFDGSLKARRQQTEPAKQLPMTLAIHAQLW